MAKILFYEWQSLTEPIFLKTLQALYPQTETFSREIKNYDMDPQFAMELLTRINQGKFDALISFNYIPLLASIANICKIKYISWVFDSPHMTLYSKTIFYDTNYVFLFDEKMYKLLKAQGVNTIYYMPLGVDTDFWRNVIESADEKEKYHSEVSFLGTLYNNQYNYYNQLQNLDAAEKKKIDRIIAKQKYRYGEDVIREALSEELIKHISDEAALYLGESYFISQSEMVTYLLQKKATVEERHEILEAVSRRFATQIYGGDDTEDIPELMNCGYADYYTEMPLIFHRSKINLNITLRSIETGIPLRVLDIMACQGFVLSNYQQELNTLFEDGKELVLFHDKEDLMDKIHYYLRHEEERKQIAYNGYQKVKRVFVLSTKVKEMMQIASL